MSQPLLTVEHLSKTFSRRGHTVHAVQDVSFTLNAGETYALVGESGSGKSTTGRSILGLTPASGGRVEFAGHSLRDLNPRQWREMRRSIQMIFQDPLSTLDPKRTVGYSIEEPLIIHGEKDAALRKKAVAAMLTQVGLGTHDAGRYPHEFSGGQRQRISIARALALDPKVVVADEAVSALDVSIQAQIINLLLDLQREMGIAFLFISHDMAVVERISHRVAVMYLGQIVEIGPRRAVFENPQHPYTRKLMAAVPVAEPGHPRAQRVLLSDDMPSNIYKPGDDSHRVELHSVGPGHYVARSTPGSTQSRF